MLRVLLAVALTLLASVATAQPVERTVERTVEYATTADGWRLALHHYRVDTPPTRRHPVIICHGVASNRFNWDLGPWSFPRYLARAGFDVWLLELRGGGESDRPALFSGRTWAYDFDDYVLNDLPAAIEYVAAAGGTGQAHWVGHSMGGMVVFGYLQRVGQARLRSVAAVASPPYLFDHLRFFDQMLSAWDTFGWLFDAVPTGTLGTLSAPWASSSVGGPATRVLWNPENLSPTRRRLLSALGTDDISAAALTQLAHSGRTHRLLSADGTYDYTAGLAKITAPFFFVAGAADHLAPPTIVAESYDRVSSTDKRLRLFSRANGDGHDYGHMDLVVGDHAPTEVFPALLNWLEAHDD